MPSRSDISLESVRAFLAAKAPDIAVIELGTSTATIASAAIPSRGPQVRPAVEYLGGEVPANVFDTGNHESRSREIRRESGEKLEQIV